MISIFLFAAKAVGHYVKRPGPSGARFQSPSIGSKIRTRGCPNKNTGKTYSKRWQDKYFFLCLYNWAHGFSELLKNCRQLVSSFMWVVFSLEQCLVWSPRRCCHCSTGLCFARNAHVGNTKCSGTKTLFWQITVVSFAIPCKQFNRFKDINYVRGEKSLSWCSRNRNHTWGKPDLVCVSDLGFWRQQSCTQSTAQSQEFTPNGKARGLPGCFPGCATVQEVTGHCGLSHCAPSALGAHLAGGLN